MQIFALLYKKIYNIYIFHLNQGENYVQRTGAKTQRTAKRYMY